MQLFSHQVLRRLVVFPLLILLPASLLLWTHGWWYQAAALMQIGLYGCGLAGWLTGTARLGRLKVLAIPFYFCLVNAASLLATFHVLRGHRIDCWEPQRQEPQRPAVAESRPMAVPAERSTG